MKTIIFLLSLFSINASATMFKFKPGDCLYFADDAKTGSVAEGSVWKIIGILEKDDKYIIRIHGGAGSDFAIKTGKYTEEGWAKSADVLSRINTDKDGSRVICPKEHSEVKKKITLI